jgi:hypothetical protein
MLRIGPPSESLDVAGITNIPACPTNRFENAVRRNAAGAFS